MLLAPESRKSMRDAQIILAYLAGTVGGAVLTAVVIWILSGFAQPLPAGVRVAVLVAGTAFVWAAKSGPLADRVRLPENRRQIPSVVLGGSLRSGALQFGFEMGAGVRTYVPAMAPYVLVLALLLVQPTLLVALAAAAGFGLGRTTPLIVRLVAPPHVQETYALGSSPRLLGPTAGLLVLMGAILLV